MKRIALVLAVVVVLAAVGAFMSIFIVDETEQVVVTRFGKIAREPVTEAGLNFRVPFVDQVHYFPKTLQQWDSDPGQFPTQDKTYIWVDTFARWEIADPVAFFETITNLSFAGARLGDIIDPAVRNSVSSYPLVETVRSSSRSLETIRRMDPGKASPSSEETASSDSTGEEKMLDEQEALQIEVGRKEITQEIKREAQPKLETFGIKLVDVKFKRINYIRQVRESVYSRMQEERNQQAEKYLSEGRGEASKIRGDKERELKTISSQAYEKAQVIKGQADAKAVTIYAQAYQRAPDFYSFIKTLETYETALDEKNSLVLSTDSELFKYLNQF